MGKLTLPSKSVVKFSVYAFFNRDPTHAHRDVFVRELKSLKQSTNGCSVLTVFGDFTDNHPRFVQIDEYGNELAVAPPASATTLEQRFKAFLIWAEQQRTGSHIPKNLPRLLLFNSHAAPPIGFTPQLLRALVAGRLDAKLKQAQKLLAGLVERSSFEYRSTQSGRAQAMKISERLRRIFPQAAFGHAHVSPDVFIQWLTDLIALRKRPLQSAAGINMLAVGTRGTGDLSVRRFATVIEQVKVRFDLTILHACNLGLFDAVFELRKASKAVVASSIYLNGTLISLDGPLRALLSQQIAPNMFAEKAAVELFRSLTYVGTGDCSDIKRGCFAALSSDTRRLVVLARHLRTFSHLLITLLQRHPGGVDQVLRDIQAEVTNSDCGCGFCHTDTRDMVNLVCTIADRLRRLEPRLPRLAKAITQTQERMIVADAVTKVTSHYCQSQQGRMTLYFPRSPRTPSYTPLDRNGFDALSITQWHLMLDAFHDS